MTLPPSAKTLAIVEIDEKSIEQYGQWPWKRDAIADIVWRLREAGAGVIVLPILFSEADRLGGDTVSKHSKATV
jgi:adenylate cyclase